MFAISWPNLSREWVEKYESWPWSSQFEPKGGHNEAKTSYSNEPNKVHIFWEGHKILQNIHRRFDRYYMGDETNLRWRVCKFCDLFRIYELYVICFLGTIHLRRRQIFTIFDPYPPTIGIPAKCLWMGFLILMYCDLWIIGTWGHPSPLRLADILNNFKQIHTYINLFFSLL